MIRLRSFALFALVSFGIVAPARAALIAYEGFDYADGSTLVGQSGGSGFAGPWVRGGFNANLVDSQLNINSPSLTFGQLETSGNRASSPARSSIGGLLRDFATSIDESATVTRYLSVLLRPEGTLGGGIFSGFFGIYLDGDAFPDPGNDEPDVFIGKPGGGALNQYVVEDRGGSQQHTSGVNAVVNQTALLVLKAELQPGIDKFTLYVNPTPGAPEPAAGTVKNDLNLGDVTGVVIYSTGAFSIDEIRWGETFADVTPIPLPSAALGALLLSPLVLSRRRRALLAS